MHRQSRQAREGFTLLELIIVIAVATILVLFLDAIPSRAPGRSKRINCVNNLKQVGLAYRTWALDHNEKYPGQVSVTNGGAMERIITGDAYFAFIVMSNELANPKVLVCPTDEDPLRKAASVFSPVSVNAPVLQGNTNTSYFVAPDAGPTNENAFLSGDRNIAADNVPVSSGLRTFTTDDSLSWMNSMHIKQGNVGLGDGSVQQLGNRTLMKGLANTGFQTNRLVFP
jgi:prepilin-type N-terminal cleavage/methylation domain-containing protein